MAMYNKRRVVFGLFIVSVFVVALTRCNSTTSSATPYHDFLQTKEFKALSTVEQIQKCATCHKQEFENEKMGPHANAYQNLQAHKDFVNSDKYDCWFYTKRVNRDFENCSGCHAPQNLFETMLRDTLNNRPKLIAGLLSIDHPLPPKRTDVSTRTTSINCFSCHYDGDKMISLKHIPTADDAIAAKQTVDVITGNNITCYPCHADVIRSISPELAIKRSGSVLCINCHQEYNEQGKGTHYYFWKHDDPAIKDNTKLISMMNDLHFDLSADKRKGQITWLNTTMPHKMSPGPEMILVCEVLDKDSNVLGEKTIRINNKKDFDVEMYKASENNNLYGILGDEVLLDGSAHQYDVALKNPTKANMMRVSFIHKAQYWFPDSLGTVTAVKTYPYIKP